jgi:hypothetical protein
LTLRRHPLALLPTLIERGLLTAQDLNDFRRSEVSACGRHPCASNPAP